MKHLLSSFILIIGLFGVALAQTHEIAHKSHSGGPSVERSTPERFGEFISPPLVRIERIQNESDTATILYFSYLDGTGAEEYRVENHEIFNAPDLDLDSLRAAYPVEVEFVGFGIGDTQLEGTAPIQPEEKSCKRKKQLLIPFSIKNGAGTLLLLLLVAFLIHSTNTTEARHLAHQ